MTNLEPINESTHAKYDQLLQTMFQINQSMLVFGNINQIQGVFSNFFEVLKGNGGLCYSTYQLGIFLSIDWGVSVRNPDWRRSFVVTEQSEYAMQQVVHGVCAIVRFSSGKTERRRKSLPFLWLSARQRKTWTKDPSLFLHTRRNPKFPVAISKFPEKMLDWKIFFPESILHEILQRFDGQGLSFWISMAFHQFISIFPHIIQCSTFFLISLEKNFTFFLLPKWRRKLLFFVQFS